MLRFRHDRLRGRLGALVLGGCLLLLSGGCSVELLHDLDDGEANTVLSALEREGLAATKLRETRGTSSSYTVAVARDDAPRAWRVLRTQSLPAPKLQGLGEVFGHVGLVPTSTQERALLHHALAGDLTRTLQSIEGVHQARVHVVLPEASPFALPDAPRPQPRAAVLLRVAAACPLHEAEAQRLVAGAIDGLDPARVSVVLHRAPATPRAAAAGSTLASVGPFRVGLESRGALIATLVVAIVLIVASGLLALVLLRRQRGFVTTLARAQQVTAEHSAVGEATRASLLERSMARNQPAEGGEQRHTGQRF
ncbi:MAG: secretion protein [Proteobacteria bacterium]|nr:secretion protein [Pseudomonadota bacterium]